MTAKAYATPTAGIIASVVMAAASVIVAGGWVAAAFHGRFDDLVTRIDRLEVYRAQDHALLLDLRADVDAITRYLHRQDALPPLPASTLWAEGPTGPCEVH